MLPIGTLCGESCVRNGRGAVLPRSWLGTPSAAATLSRPRPHISARSQSVRDHVTVLLQGRPRRTGDSRRSVGLMETVSELPGRPLQPPSLPVEWDPQLWSAASCPLCLPCQLCMATSVSEDSLCFQVVGLGGWALTSQTVLVWKHSTF